MTHGSGKLGTRVIINGTNLRGYGSNIVSVSLAGIAAIIFSESDFIIVVNAASLDTNVDVIGDVIITSDTGASATVSSGWTYKAQGSIFSVTPSIGYLGTRVVINGSLMLGYGTKIISATLNNIAATISDSSNEVVNLIAGDGSSVQKIVGPVKLVADSGAVLILADSWN